MSKQKSNLIVCAHPDDESIYFSGLVLQKTKFPWVLVCVTDGNADGQKMIRSKQLKEACHKLNIEQVIHLDFPDTYEKRINTKELTKRLKSISDINDVYTHGIIGEYGHPHHQDVSYATHQAFKNVYSISYNCFPELVINLTARQYELKTQILSQIYGSEINRFAHIVAGTWQEGFSRIKLLEIENIYQHLSGHKPLELNQLDQYKWLYQHISETLSTSRNRMF